jgi:hypothetical protein
VNDTVSFADDLYRSMPHLGGAGFLGFARTASWCYSRHDRPCKPGKWLVTLCSQGDYDGFVELLFPTADAVVDDFGNLRRVQ